LLAGAIFIPEIMPSGLSYHFFSDDLQSSSTDFFLLGAWC